MGGRSDELPSYSESLPRGRKRRTKHLFLLIVAICWLGYWASSDRVYTGPVHASAFADSIAKCRLTKLPAGVPDSFYSRQQSDRYDEEKAIDTLIRNATVWTGENDGKEILEGASLLLSKGLIAKIYKAGDALPDGLAVLDAHGAFLTPGLFDMHSHIGVDPLPHLFGGDSTNSLKQPVMPFLRSLDGINTHDKSYHRTVAGGVTTALILPGSANNIGGQAFVIKLRDVKSNSPGEMVLEMPWNVASPRFNNESYHEGDPLRFRHMKAACGENIMRVYHSTRMDESWNFRSALEKARNLRNKQDRYCEKAEMAVAAGQILDEDFPDELEWEALVDVLRGRVKVNVHCYEATDFQAFVDHTREFQFPVAAFHHAHEAYLVPDLLKSSYGNQPALAMFATNARYKREAWRGSNEAAKILNEANMTVIGKSDHPVLDSRYLLFEAQQFHHFGLPANKALRSVITASAETAGFGYRLGYIRHNYDADIVLWDRYPLELGATPIQVYIDGQKQFEKHTAVHSVAISKHGGLGAKPDSRRVSESVLFTNVKEILAKGVAAQTEGNEVLVENGQITCVGRCRSLTEPQSSVIDLMNGSILPPLIAFGPGLGLIDIIAEASTNDGSVSDQLDDGKLSVEDESWAVQDPVRAYDGLQFDGKHLKVARESGISYALTAPTGNSFHRGLSTIFSTGAKHLLEKGAVKQEVVAMHVDIGHHGSKAASIATQISALQRLLLSDSETYFTAASNASLPLVIGTDKADVIARLIVLKQDVERRKGHKNLKWIINGAAEAHLLAKELAEAKMSVILNAPRAKADDWDRRRVLDGPPMTEFNALSVLTQAGVLTAIGVPEEWQACQLMWEAAWASLIQDGISRETAIAWLSNNMVKMFGLPAELTSGFVAFQGDPFQFGSRAIAMSSVDGESVDIL